MQMNGMLIFVMFVNIVRCWVVRFCDFRIFQVIGLTRLGLGDIGAEMQGKWKFFLFTS